MKLNLSIYAALLLVTTSGAHADGRWGVGMGTMVEKQGYLDIDNKTNVIPLFYYESEKLRVLGPTVDYQLATFNDFKFKLSGQYRFDGFESDDGDIFSGMEERSGSVDLGFSIDYEHDFGDFSFSFLNDVSSEHKGNEITLSYAKPFQVDSTRITPYVELTRLSDDLVDYYYGVRANEVTANRSYYLGEASTNAEIGIRTNWQFGNHHSFMLNASYTAFGSEIKDSPLMDSSGSANLILGYLYVF